MKAGLFPGQGVAVRHVLAGLPRDHERVIQASEIIGIDLRRRIAAAASNATGALPTNLAQPAILVAGVIAYEERDETFDVFIGHSLGEFTALCCAGAFSFKDAVRLVNLRGAAMQRAAQVDPGGMVAVINVDPDLADQIAQRSGVEVANHNSPNQTVLSGDDAGLAQASRLTAEAGGRAVRLAVSGAFHSRTMIPAAGALEEALIHTAIRKPRTPVISNATARPYRAPGEIRKLLVRQLSAPVLFRQSIEWAADRGVTGFVDLGPGRIVGPLATACVRSRPLEVVDA